MHFRSSQTSAKIHCLLSLQKNSNRFFALIIGGVACNLFQTEYVLNHGVSQACTEKKQGCFLQMMRCKVHCGWLKPPQGTFLLLRPAQLKIQLRFLGCDFESCCSSACNLPGLCSVQSKILLSGLLSLSRLQARHYYQIIKRPIDLSVVRAKLNKRSSHFYSSPEEFVADVCLMFRNCAKFNYVGFFGVFFNLIPCRKVKYPTTC